MSASFSSMPRNPIAKPAPGLQTSRFSATTCRANAGLPRLRPTCSELWQRGIPKPGASRWR